MTTGSTTTDHPVRRLRALESPLFAVAAIWTTSAVIGVATPDMVSGSEHEHLPLAMLTVWLWAAVATAYALMTPRRDGLADWSLSVAGLWAVTALVAVLSPEMVTGSDPTRIPIAALVAPPVAAVVTGMLSLRQANLAP